MTSCLISSIMELRMDFVDMMDLMDSEECIGDRWRGRDELEDGPAEVDERRLSMYRFAYG
jgi:hypothetical protein